jgi:hypothetical protein
VINPSLIEAIPFPFPFESDVEVGSISFFSLRFWAKGNNLYKVYDVYKA